MEFLLSPGGVLGAISGLGFAALIHWLFPSLQGQLSTLYAGLVVGGFLLGIVLEDFGKGKK